MTHQLGSNGVAKNEDWRSENPGLVRKLTYSVNSGRFTDVSFAFVNAKSGNKSSKVLKAHKLILSLSSPVFEAMFNGQFEESSKPPGEPIQIVDTTFDAFKSMLEFIYREKLPAPEMSFEHIFQTMYAANKYCIFELQKGCSELISKRISDKNVISTFQHGQLLNDKGLIDNARIHIQSRFEHLLNCEEFLNFSYNNLCMLLADSKTCVDNEIILFRSLVKWSEAECHRQNLNVTPVNKRTVLGRITNLIQFSQMKPADVSREVFDSNILNKDEMLLLLRHISVSPNDTSDLPKLPFAVIKRQRTLRKRDNLKRSTTYDSQLRIPNSMSFRELYPGFYNPPELLSLSPRASYMALSLSSVRTRNLLRRRGDGTPYPNM